MGRERTHALSSAMVSDLAHLDSLVSISSSQAHICVFFVNGRNPGFEEAAQIYNFDGPDFFNLK